ncbi:MAG: hypothetical protein AMXMBFR84_50120 [Candidatus Hydrogenedentota bacterium]
MSRLPALKSRQLIAALKKAGFSEARQSGSHCILKHPDGREVVVPVHSRDLKRSTMKSIIKQAGLTVEELVTLL